MINIVKTRTKHACDFLGENLEKLLSCLFIMLLFMRRKNRLVWLESGRFLQEKASSEKITFFLPDSYNMNISQPDFYKITIFPAGSHKIIERKLRQILQTSVSFLYRKFSAWAFLCSWTFVDFSSDSFTLFLFIFEWCQFLSLLSKA